MLWDIKPEEMHDVAVNLVPENNVILRASSSGGTAVTELNGVEVFQIMWIIV